MRKIENVGNKRALRAHARDRKCRGKNALCVRMREIENVGNKRALRAHARDRKCRGKNALCVRMREIENVGNETRKIKEIFLLQQDFSLDAA